MQNGERPYRSSKTVYLFNAPTRDVKNPDGFLFSFELNNRVETENVIRTGIFGEDNIHIYDEHGQLWGVSQTEDRAKNHIHEIGDKHGDYPQAYLSLFCADMTIRPDMPNTDPRFYNHVSVKIITFDNHRSEKYSSPVEIHRNGKIILKTYFFKDVFTPDYEPIIFDCTGVSLVYRSDTTVLTVSKPYDQPRFLEPANENNDYEYDVYIDLKLAPDTKVGSNVFEIVFVPWVKFKYTYGPRIYIREKPADLNASMKLLESPVFEKENKILFYKTTQASGEEKTYHINEKSTIVVEFKGEKEAYYDTLPKRFSKVDIGFGHEGFPQLFYDGYVTVKKKDDGYNIYITPYKLLNRIFQTDIMVSLSEIQKINELLADSGMVLDYKK